MKKSKVYAFVLGIMILCSCNNKTYPSNGETIYRTGKNLQGERILDRRNSRIKIVNSCKSCHGKNGDAMKNTSIKFSSLRNPDNFETPYTDSLFFRFLDHDLKSNGVKANIGVIWKMNDNDKLDLLKYLKTLH